MKQARPDLEKDVKDLAKLGYAQELLREMGGFSNFAVSFSVISILTGATQLYGYGLSHGGPLQMSLGWCLVSLFTLFVALSLAELASSYPTSGALYHWSHFLGGRGFGWFTACFNTIGQFALLAGVDYGLSQFLQGLMGLPESLTITFSIYATILLTHALLNHRGIAVVSWLNNFSAFYHIGVVLILITALFFSGFVQPVSFLLVFKSTDGYKPQYSFLIGLLLAQWTFTGYDASAHVSEETADPRRNAPWGIFLAVVISIIVGFVMLTAVTLSIPNLSQAIGFGDGAFFEILKLRLGVHGGTLIASLIAGAMWLCGLATLTSASRMVFAFSRDGGLPFSNQWAKISVKHRTPAKAIWILTFFALLLAVSVKLYSAIVSVATIALYVSYGLPILARLYGKWRYGTNLKGPWNLGVWSTAVSIVAVLWVTFICVLFILPPNDQAGTVVFALLGILIFIWFFKARKNFRGPPKIGI